jgi:hypothetical protein
MYFDELASAARLLLAKKTVSDLWQKSCVCVAEHSAMHILDDIG